MKVAINPGHHKEYDPGAIGPNGLREADVVYDVAIKLQRLLCETSFITSNSLEEICDLANASEADIFISIHANAAENSSAEGTEVFHLHGSEEGHKLASCILPELVSLGLVDRGVKQAQYYVLKYTDIPAVLVELEFISNPDGEQRLADEDFRQKCAESICRGIRLYKTM